MGYTNLKSILDANIKTNGSQSITGAKLNQVLTQCLQGVDIADRANGTDTTGKTYKILSRSSTFASQVTGTNTIYEIRDTFDLGGNSVTIPTGCILYFNGGSLTNGTIVGQNTLMVGEPQLGVSCSGSFANETIFQKWFSSISHFVTFFNNVSGVSCFEFEPGDHAISGNFQKTIAGNITIHGNGARLIASSADFTMELMGGDVTATKSVVSFPAGNQIELSDVSSLNVGDHIAIRDTAASSFSFYRNYQEGELATIVGIDSANSIITIDHDIMGQYHIASSNVYKYAAGTCEIDSLEFVCNSDAAQTFGLLVGNMSSVFLNNVKATGYMICGRVMASKNISVTNCIFKSSLQTYSSDGYGLQFSNCQNAVVSGGEFLGYNHGISIGGTYTDPLSIVNRLITIENTISKSSRATWASLDCHGNSEFVSFVNNVCAGIDFGGKHIRVEGNRCLASRGITGYELISLNNEIIGNDANRFYLNLQKSTYPGQSNDNWHPETGKEILRVHKNHFDGKAFGEPCGVYFNSNLTGIYSNIANIAADLSGNVFENNLTMRLWMSIGDTANDAYANLGGEAVFKDNVFSINSVQNVTMVARNLTFRNCTISSLVNALSVYCSRLTIDKTTLSITESATAISPAKAFDFLWLTNNLVLTGYLVATSLQVAKAYIIDNIIENTTDKARVCSLTNGESACRGYAFGNKMGHVYNVNIGTFASLSYGGNHSISDGTRMIPHNSAVAVFPSETMNGTTTQRPALNSAGRGTTYYDNTISKLILWNGSAWVNLDGSALS